MTSAWRASASMTSSGYLFEHLHEVPVHVIPCVEGRTDGAVLVDQATAFGSILPAVWSFMLAARSRGSGRRGRPRTSSTRPRWRICSGSRPTSSPRSRSSPSRTRSATTSVRLPADRSTRSCTGTVGDADSEGSGTGERGAAGVGGDRRRAAPRPRRRSARRARRSARARRGRSRRPRPRSRSSTCRTSSGSQSENARRSASRRVRVACPRGAGSRCPTSPCRGRPCASRCASPGLGKLTPTKQLRVEVLRRLEREQLVRRSS